MQLNVLQIISAAIAFLYYIFLIWQCIIFFTVSVPSLIRYGYFWHSFNLFIFGLLALLFFSHSVTFDSLQPHGLKHPWLPYPSPPPGICSNSCPSNLWCHPPASCCHRLLLWPLIFPSIRVFSSELVLHIRWPKHWSFSYQSFQWIFRIDFL